MSKPLCSLLTAFMIITLITTSAMQFGGAQTSGTSVTGLIVTDTTWAASNGPYTLIGNMLVDKGATLTIQPGTTVNLGGYYLMVNGTLQAIGASNSPITFNANTNAYPISSNPGQLIFTPFCNGYNTYTSTGCILQNTIINAQLLVSNSVQITQNTINNGVTIQSNMNSMQTGTPTISNNNIKGGISVGNTLGSAVITDNKISGGGISFGSMNPPNVTISGNTISGCYVGISASLWGLSMNNIVQRIEGNLIFNNSQGINLANWEGGTYPTVKDNTVTNNTVGICVSYPWGNNAPSLTAPIVNNNIYGNTKYDFQNQQPSTINATNNWWGTTDTQAISQKIYDYYDDFNIGKVIYSPLLTAPNQVAPTYIPPTTAPTPTATPTPTPTSIPTATPPPQQTTNQSTTVPATTDKGALVGLVINGNITAPQMSNVIIETNQSATTTVLSFTVTGQSGTAGFSNITIAKNDLPYRKIPAVYVDGQLAEGQGYAEDADYFYVWYTTHFSTHNIEVVFSETAVAPNSTAVPQGTSGPADWLQLIGGIAIGASIVGAIMVALLLLTKTKKPKNQ